MSSVSSRYLFSGDSCERLDDVQAVSAGDVAGRLVVVVLRAMCVPVRAFVLGAREGRPFASRSFRRGGSAGGEGRRPASSKRAGRARALSVAVVPLPQSREAARG